MRLQLKLKSITLRPAKCWSKDGTPKLKKWCCNVLSGQGHRAPWSNGGIAISRGKPQERGQKPVHVVFRKHVIRDWITLQLFLVLGAHVFYLTMLPIVYIIQHRTRGELSYLAPLGSENISRPLFQAVFLSGGGYYPPRLSQTPRLPVRRQK